MQAILGKNVCLYYGNNMCLLCMAWNDQSKISDLNCLMELMEVFHWKYRISQKGNALQWRFNMTHCNTKQNGTGDTRDGKGHKNQEQAY